MDNLTHSLVGALLGQMGLKRKTGLAMPTLIIAANIPDIDAITTLLGGQQHLALRRGLTHGPIAMLVLPLLLWGTMLAFDRWQTKQGKRPEKRLSVHKGWLLALAYIGCLSHPLFDWFNSYGIRLLEQLLVAERRVSLIVSSHGFRLLRTESEVGDLAGLRTAVGAERFNRLVTVFDDGDRGAE